MANFFEWDPARYGVGVAEMDGEHQVIISHMNRVHQLSADNAPLGELKWAVDALVESTKRHFAHEEAYMERIGFPQLAGHKALHRDLLEKVVKHKAAFDKSGKLTEEFFMFLRMWLKAHICGTDAKYGAQRKAA